MPYTRMYSGKCSDSHYQIRYIVRERKHCPRTQFLTTRGSDHSSNTHSLSLRNSCSNELNHTSDAAEDHDHGYKLSATELLNLFLSFCPTLRASSQHCLPLPTDRSLSSKDRNPKLSSYLHLVLHTIFLLRFSSISSQTLSFFSFYLPSETCCSFSIKLLHPASLTSFPSFHSVLPPHPHAAVTGCCNKMAANKSTNTKNQQAFTLN